MQEFIANPSSLAFLCGKYCFLTCLLTHWVQELLEGLNDAEILPRKYDAALLATQVLRSYVSLSMEIVIVSTDNMLFKSKIKSRVHHVHIKCVSFMTKGLGLGY
ncbi:hypothetical protein DM860_005562 [Cuscuta australis]|uniref:Uncharacterized protein n=1 Tax=Cuscuta australis TaxID=267555 RepID=A0A328DUC7_9ASTE|nr:hypothetical protein DM860_005562 [Cuscuta australis]